MSNFRIFTIACLSALALADGAMLASAAPLVMTENGADTLTLSGAKQIVAHRLTELGKTDWRPGRAEFDRDGNVSVEIVTLQGIAVRHVRVDAKSGMVTDARTGSPLAMAG